MSAELVAGILVWVAIFLFIILVGSDLFALMVDEQVRYLRLIIFYAPVPAKACIPSGPGPVARYVSSALKNNAGPVGCARIRFTGRTRYGAQGRWMETRGEVIFSLATPGYVWHAKIAYAPGIWLEAFDYYVHGEAGMNLNLLSVFPLDNSRDEKINPSALFRYLARTPLFPMVLASSGSITWETVDETTATAIIYDADLSARALVRFDGQGWIGSIEACQKTHPETGRPVPGHFASRFSGYTEVGGYTIPMQFAADMILPDGEYVCAEYSITGVEYDTPDAIRQGGS